MKRRDLVRKLTQNGWWLDRHGGNHDIYTNEKQIVSVPRHTEIDDNLAKAILRKAGLR